MKEYIDKEKLIKVIEEADCDVLADYGPEYGTEWGFSREAIKNIVQNFPAIDAAEVRPEASDMDVQNDAPISDEIARRVLSRLEALKDGTME